MIGRAVCQGVDRVFVFIYSAPPDRGSRGERVISR